MHQGRKTVCHFAQKLLSPSNIFQKLALLDAHIVHLINEWKYIILSIHKVLVASKFILLLRSSAYIFVENDIEPRYITTYLTVIMSYTHLNRFKQNRYQLRRNFWTIESFGSSLLKTVNKFYIKSYKMRVSY